MVHDVFRSTAGAKPNLRVGSQQLLNDIKNRFGRLDRKRAFFGEDGLVDFVLIVPSEGRLTEDHLIYQNAKGPPVYRKTVRLVQQDLDNLLAHRLALLSSDRGVGQEIARQRLGMLNRKIFHLRSHEFGSPAERPRRRQKIGFTKPKVDQFDVSIAGQHNVVELHVSIENILFVQESQN